MATQKPTKRTKRKQKRRSKASQKKLKLDTFLGSRDFFRDLLRLTKVLAKLTARIVSTVGEDIVEEREDSLDRVDAVKRPKVLKGKRKRRLLVVQQAIDKAEVDFTRTIPIEEVQTIIRKNAGKIDKQNREQVFKQAKAAIGITRLEDPKTSKERATFVRDNVNVIKTIGPDHFSKIRKIVDEGFQKGTSSRVLKDRIAEVANVTERRAALIARDQVGSLNANLTKARHVANGFTSFIWRTVGDERVRDEHEAIDGQTFPYSTGAPGEGFPGDPIACRCFAEPVFT